MFTFKPPLSIMKKELLKGNPSVITGGTIIPVKNPH